MKYFKIALKIQEFTNFGISAVTFEPYIIESFCESCCVRRPSKPRYKAQIYCSILYGFVVMGISNMVKYGDFDVFGHIWSTHKILTVHDRAINLGSIPRFWGSTNAARLRKLSIMYGSKVTAEMPKLVNSWILRAILPYFKCL